MSISHQFHIENKKPFKIPLTALSFFVYNEYVANDTEVQSTGMRIDIEQDILLF